MTYMQVDQVKLYYEIHGQGEPLLLIAGFGADTTVWETILADLTLHYQVIIFDNRDAGQSEVASKPYSIIDMAADTAQLLDKLQIKQAHVLGQSMGTLIAQMLALHHPKKINKLILANGFAKMNTLGIRLFKTIEKMIDAKVSLDIIIETLIPWLYSNTSLSQLEKLPQLQRRINSFYTNPHPQTAEGFKRQLAAMLAENTTPHLKNITHPTLVIAGEVDCMVPVSDSNVLANNIPRANLQVMPQLAHLAHNEQPELFVATMRQFLA